MGKPCNVEPSLAQGYIEKILRGEANKGAWFCKKFVCLAERRYDELTVQTVVERMGGEP